ncbi:MAG: hypothetical protein RLZZ618_152 [Pseudomonadota bacterium]|jgi:hypothetical protein
MLRAPNPFDTRRGHAAQRLASGGANCSTCTSTSSCVVSAVVVGVLSSRMASRAPELEPGPADRRTAPASSSTAGAPVDPRAARLTIAALLPAALFLALLGWFSVLIEGSRVREGGVLALAVGVGLLGLMWWALRFAAHRNNSITRRLLALLLLLFPALVIGEAFLWMLVVLR